MISLSTMTTTTTFYTELYCIWRYHFCLLLLFFVWCDCIAVACMHACILEFPLFPLTYPPTYIYTYTQCRHRQRDRHMHLTMMTFGKRPPIDSHDDQYIYLHSFSLSSSSFYLFLLRDAVQYNALYCLTSSLGHIHIVIPSSFSRWWFLLPTVSFFLTSAFVRMYWVESIFLRF